MIKVKIQRAYIEVSEEELTQIEKAVNFAIDRFEHVVRDVEVTLVDINGPRGGVDKRCNVQIRLYPRGLLVVRNTGSSIIETVNGACDKMRQVITKRLSKQKARAQFKLTTDISENGVSAS